MRIALLSDIHGNHEALEAVLASIASEGNIDAYWILGDLVALGPDPIRVLERLNSLPNVRFVRGNTDRYVAFGDRPGPTAEEVVADSNLAYPLAEVANTFAWTQGMVTAGGWLEWLRGLPLELRETLPDGTRFLGVHASPGRDDGPGVTATMESEQLAALFTQCQENLVCVGHTHQPSEQQLNGIHIVNLGAVSLSRMPEGDASYVVLDATKEGYKVFPQSVSYNRKAVIAKLEALHHPARTHLIRLLSGEGPNPGE
jgi:predicted phosphodiesterase